MAGRKNFSNYNIIKLKLIAAINANLMNVIALQQALLNRIAILKWKTIFTTDKSKVNPAKGIYQADRTYKTSEYWSHVSSAVMNILIKRFKHFQSKNYELSISEKVQIRTLQELESCDPFMTWFKSKYIILPTTKQNKKSFILKSEIIDEFKKLSAVEQFRITRTRTVVAEKYIADQISVQPRLIQRFSKKVTNWRISRQARRAKGAFNKSGVDKQYVSNAIVAVKIKQVEDDFDDDSDCLMNDDGVDDDDGSSNNRNNNNRNINNEIPVYSDDTEDDDDDADNNDDNNNDNNNNNSHNDINGNDKEEVDADDTEDDDEPNDSNGIHGNGNNSYSSNNNTNNNDDDYDEDDENTDKANDENDEDYDITDDLSDAELMKSPEAPATPPSLRSVRTRCWNIESPAAKRRKQY